MTYDSSKRDELRDEITRLKAENEKLKLELEIYRGKKYGTINMSTNPILAIDGYEIIDCNHQAIKNFNFSSKEELIGKKTYDLAPFYQYKLNETLYMDIFKDNPSMMLLVDPTDGSIYDANEAACCFYGYTKDEMANMHIGQINILPNKKVHEEMNNATETIKNKFYFKHKLASGEIRDVEVTSGPIEINDKQYLYSIIYDVTEKNNISKLLDESEKKFKQLFNKINDGLFFFKVEEDGGPGKFLEVNDVACRTLGYSYEEMLNMSPFDVDINERDKFLKLFKQIHKDGEATFEAVHTTKDRRNIPVEINAHVFYWLEEKFILAVARDITHRKKIEKSLKDNIAKQQRIMAFLPDGVFIVKNDKIVFVNECGKNLLGYASIRELLGKKYLNILHDDYHVISKERFKQMKHDNMIVPLIEEKYLKKNGEALDVEVTGVRIPYGKDFAFLIVARDISERKKVRHELDEKICFEKLRTEFFSNISHELRTPLNVLLGSLQLQALYMDNDLFSVNQDKHKQIHKRMKQNCYRLLRLVNNIIDITRIDSGFYDIDLQNCDIIVLIENIVSSVEDYVKNKNLTITFTTDISKLVIACDPEKIERIILNLLSNAIKFSKPQGKIEVNIDSNENELFISIKDYGIGIPKEKLEDIFNRFSQVDKSLTRNHEGSGIGLSLVKSLVEMHKGVVTVKSEVTKGSEFTLKLPMRQIQKSTIMKDYKKSNNYFNIERMHIEFSDIYSSM
ncbi:MAG: PAS domain S-box protein [Clostridiaceae bacterium]|nr:PAS domain S-box protein [Clostridiaceae bacterium]